VSGLSASETVERGPARSARKAKGEGHLRRAEILHAAEHVFIEYGYEGATIRRIADEVGVSSTALYMHFRDKSEILTEICEGLFENLIEVNTQLIERDDLDPVQRVRLMLDAYVDFALEHPNVYRLVFCTASGDFGSDHEAPLEAMGERTYVLFRAAVQRIADARRLRDPNVDVAAQTSWASVHGMLSLILLKPRFHWEPTRVLCAALLDTVFRGLAD
jgi:AcrR family transcriptional regulator